MTVQDTNHSQCCIGDTKEDNALAISDAAKAFAIFGPIHTCKADVRHRADLGEHSEDKFTRGDGIIELNKIMVIYDIRSGCCGPDGASRFNSPSPSSACAGWK